MFPNFECGVLLSIFPSLNKRVSYFLFTTDSLYMYIPNCPKYDNKRYYIWFFKKVKSN